jgi:hypothetical protein
MNPVRDLRYHLLGQAVGGEQSSEISDFLGRHIDLVGLDYDTKFSKKIKEIGKLTRVA